MWKIYFIILKHHQSDIFWKRQQRVYVTVRVLVVASEVVSVTGADSLGADVSADRVLVYPHNIHTAVLPYLVTHITGYIFSIRQDQARGFIETGSQGNHLAILTKIFPKTWIQSGLNISESVILTNSNNDTDLVGTNFFIDFLIRYSGKLVLRLWHKKTGNQTCYFRYNQYPLHWHLVKHASSLRKLHCLIALLYCISALDRKVWSSVGRYEKVRQRCSVSDYTN